VKVGVVGQGFVGTAVYEGLKNHHTLYCYDKDLQLNVKRLGVANLELLAEYSEIIFVCVPTPMDEDGKCHTGYVEEVIKDIDECTEGKIVVIKSTISPGTTAKLNAKYKNNTIVFSPDIIKTDSTYAEMIKYVTNNFLTVKVAFANEMYKVCERLRIDYDKVVEYATLDERLGSSHWGVPGPDGGLGFGGHCFPKDLSAMIELTKDLQTPNFVLRGAQDTNDELRKNRDWEDMEGRAVINKEESNKMDPWHRALEEVRP